MVSTNNPSSDPFLHIITVVGPTKRRRRWENKIEIVRMVGGWNCLTIMSIAGLCISSVEHSLSSIRKLLVIVFDAADAAATMYVSGVLHAVLEMKNSL
jgi:hypothetical protein